MSQTEELLSLPGGTIHHLPPACRKPLADVLAEAMRRLREKRDAQSAWLVALFPRLVLYPLVRGGLKHNRQATGVVMDRLQRWSAGAFRELTTQAIQACGGGKPKPKAKLTAQPPVDLLDPTRVLVPPDVMSQTEELLSGVKVLGVPVGSPSFIQDYSRKVLCKLQICRDRLSRLGCAFSAFHIFRSCLSACKIMFLLRTLPYDLALELATGAPTRMRGDRGRIARNCAHGVWVALWGDQQAGAGPGARGPGRGSLPAG